MKDLQILLEIYTVHPCRTLPNAFWKTAARWASSNLMVTWDSVGQPSSLVLWEGQRLLAFWCADAENQPLTTDEIAEVPFALVHTDALPVFAGRDFSFRQPYFRLIHEGGLKAHPCPEGFAFECVDPEMDIYAVADLIRACYPSMRVNAEIVQSWLNHPVYDMDLWLWVIDLETHIKAALGIAERDSRVPEASLEWIQVHPTYQKKGLGKALVHELTWRASDGVKFVTVAGEVENRYQPEKLYRHCGFTGSDIWWFLSDHP